MKRGYKSGRGEAHNEETSEIDTIEIFRVKEKVWDAQILAETPRDHREQDYPTEDQNDVPLEVIQKQLNGERIRDPWSKVVEPSEHNN